ncbi:hypothetical protein NDU88_000704 [Pleurodeles waltl]|uniref:Uncharacterized protein n=1 Tax=Pleurodeles waltl TaxID=8319 RepID=A0AAV7UQR0_PLEWA|nr:hypothetical protein NDU88_000704 [Pleurodeles waltl]
MNYITFEVEAATVQPTEEQYEEAVRLDQAVRTEPVAEVENMQSDEGTSGLHTDERADKRTDKVAEKHSTEAMNPGLGKHDIFLDAVYSEAVIFSSEAETLGLIIDQWQPSGE